GRPLLRRRHGHGRGRARAQQSPRPARSPAPSDEQGRRHLEARRHMKLLILDRDGVINEDSDAFIKNPDEWHPLPGAAAAIARLNKAGYRIAIATNQSGIARGLFDLDTLAAIHTKLHQAINEAGG